MANFDISKKDIRRILNKTIIPQIIGSIRPTRTKEVFILGGQPGSGKSVFAREILQKNKNIVFINGDDIRVYHPRYFFYLRANDKEAADQTQAVCNFWIEELIKECFKKNLSFIVEGTMRRYEPAYITASAALEYGYHVNLILVSTPYRLSLFSTKYRYREVKKMEGFARFTKKQAHDVAYKNISKTVSILLEKDIFSKFFIYKRYARTFKKYSFEEPGKVLKVFESGRTRKLNAYEEKFCRS